MGATSFRGSKGSVDVVVTEANVSTLAEGLVSLVKSTEVSKNEIKKIHRLNLVSNVSINVINITLFSETISSITEFTVSNIRQNRVIKRGD